LSGNKHPYLSVNIKSVVSHGKRLESCNDENKEDYKNTLKRLNPDLYFLYQNDLTSMGDYNQMHEIANGYYFIEQCRKYMWREDILTKTGLRDMKKDIEDQVLKICDKLLKALRLNKITAFKSFNDSVLEAVKNPYQSLTKLELWVSKASCVGHLTRSKVVRETFEVLEGLQSHYKELGDTKEYNLPCDKDIWTIERLAEYFDLNVDTTRRLVLDCKSKEDLAREFQERIEQRGTRLESLTEKYNIPVIKS